VSVQISVDTDGLGRVSRRITRLMANARDMQPAMEEIADDFARDNARRFAAQGPGWAPLTASTIRSRRYPGKPILSQTEALKNSLTSRPLGVERITNNNAVLGTNVPYAGFHQSGTSRMPARRIVEIDGGRRVRWKFIIAKRFLRP
jgi:phage gpG-like protein